MAAYLLQKGYGFASVYPGITERIVKEREFGFSYALFIWVPATQQLPY